MFEKGTIQLAVIAGIPIRLHWSFMLIFLWVGYNAWVEHLPLKTFLFLELYVLILFTCVVLHEYGHALVARKYGHKTRDILLTPIGGIARLESISEKPIQELLIAVAGPAVNFLIVIILFIYLFTIGGYSISNMGMIISSEFWQYNNDLVPLIMKSNLILGVFNFIPAFPMDGGRILRSLLSFQWSRLKATVIAARLGQISAILFLIFAISEGHWMLCLVSFFIFLTAGTELKQVKWESILQSVSARELMSNDYSRMLVTDSLEVPINCVMKGLEKNYLIYTADQLIGILPYNRILFAAKNKMSGQTVSAILNSDIVIAAPGQPLKEVFQQMQMKGATLTPVMDHGEVIGVLDDSQIKRFVELRLNNEI